MITVTASEAKVRLSTLLELVAGGDEVVITKRGKPVARLVNIKHIEPKRAKEACDQLKRLRRGTTLGGLPWKSLRDDGRR